MDFRILDAEDIISLKNFIRPTPHGENHVIYSKKTVSYFTASDRYFV